MSSRFDRAYRVSGTTVVNADLWNRIMRDIDTRIVAVEEKKADFEEAEKTLLELALRRINETLLPAAQRIQAVSELGFLIASSDEELTVVPDQQASLRISEGAQRDLFTPSPFVALTRRSTVEDYAIARVVTYNRDTGILVVHIESVTGNPGPHNDWDVVALAGAVMAQMATLDETKALRAEVANDKAAVALDKAAAQSARTEAQAARDAAIIAKTGAESALASFMQVYRGALPSAPPDGEQGHFYFDTTLQMALVYTATGWAPLFQVALGGIRQGFITATAGQTEIDIGGDFTFINVWKNGSLLTAGVDYTTASPKIILANPASGGDEIAYTGYHSTDASDFYTKMAADNRFTRKDSTTVERMSGPLEVRRLLTVKANETGNVDIAIVNNEGNEVASIYATPSTRYVALRRVNGDGTFETLAFLQGRLVYNGQDIHHSGIALDAFVQGLTLSNNADDPNNKIDIAPGRARGNGVTVVNPAVFTATLGGAIRQPNTTYHVHALRNDTTGEFAVTFGLSATSPSVPSGYTRVQRLGAILTDGSGNIRPFVQDGNKFMHLGGVLDYFSASARDLSPLTVTVPNGVRVEGIFGCNIVAADGDAGVTIEVCDGSNQNIRKQLTTYVNTGVNQLFATVEQFTNTTRQVLLAIQWAPHPTQQCGLRTLGWIDYQIPRIG